MTVELGIDVLGGALEQCYSELLRQRLLTELLVASPVAGAEWSFPIGNVAFVELLGVAYKLATSAVVANRRSSLQVKDGNGVVLGQVDAVAVQAAGVTNQYVYQRDVAVPQSLAALTQTLPLAGVPLMQGWTVGTSTALLDAGDQYSAIALIVRQWSSEAIVRQAEWIARRFPDLALEQ